MKKLYLFLSASLLFSTQLSHAIIFQITRWYHPELQQEVNLLKDMHLDTADCEATIQQQKDIKAREHISFRIVEDICEHPHPAARKFMATRGLVGCPVAMPYLIITPSNKASLNHNDYQLDQYKQAVEISTMHLLYLLTNTYNAECRYDSDTINKTIDEIATYNDGLILNAYYAHTLENRNNVTLVNARTVHALYNNPDKKIIDIIMGAIHCNEIESIITQLGYIKKETIGYDNRLTQWHNDLRKFLNIIPVVNIQQALKIPFNVIEMEAAKKREEMQALNREQIDDFFDKEDRYPPL